MINGEEYVHEEVIALGGVERLDRDVGLCRDDLDSSSTHASSTRASRTYRTQTTGTGQDIRRKEDEDTTV